MYALAIDQKAAGTSVYTGHVYIDHTHRRFVASDYGYPHDRPTNIHTSYILGRSSAPGYHPPADYNYTGRVAAVNHPSLSPSFHHESLFSRVHQSSNFSLSLYFSLFLVSFLSFSLFSSLALFLFFSSLFFSIFLASFLSFFVFSSLALSLFLSISTFFSSFLSLFFS